nr:thioredoxin family protein [Microbacterium invictum]
MTLGIGGYVRWQQNRPRPERRGEVVEAQRLGAESLGEAATLLQFSTELCAQCPGVHRTLTSIADERAGVLHLNVDLTHRPDIAKHFNVLQTPTTLILDRHGVVQTRFGGAPRRDVVELELTRVTEQSYA